MNVIYRQVGKEYIEPILRMNKAVAKMQCKEVYEELGIKFDINKDIKDMYFKIAITLMIKGYPLESRREIVGNLFNPLEEDAVENGIIISATKDKKLIGYIFLNSTDTEGVYIASQMYILEKYRRQGVGTGFINTIFDSLGLKGILADNCNEASRAMLKPFEDRVVFGTMIFTKQWISDNEHEFLKQRQIFGESLMDIHQMDIHERGLMIE